MIKTSLIYNLYNLKVLRKIFMSWSPKDGGDESPWGGNEKKNNSGKKNNSYKPQNDYDDTIQKIQDKLKSFFSILNSPDE